MSNIHRVVVYCACLFVTSTLGLAQTESCSQGRVAAEADLRSGQEVMLGTGAGSGSIELPAGTRVQVLQETGGGWKVRCDSFEFVVPRSELQFVNASPPLKASGSRPADQQTSTSQQTAEVIWPKLRRGVEVEVELKGMIKSYRHKARKNVMCYTLYSFEGGKLELPRLGRNTAKGVSLDGFDDTAAKVALRIKTESTGDLRNAGVVMLLGVEKLDESEGRRLLRLSEKRQAAEKARAYNPSPQALPYSGTWGVRLPLPSEKNGIKAVEQFDVHALAKQLSELKTANHVILNITQPAGPCYFTGPHPQLEKILNTRSYFSNKNHTDRGSFPRRGLIGEALDAVKATGKKTFVYFACEGFHTDLAQDSLQDAWFEYIESLGMAHYEAVGELILRHYAERYGTKIDGWWFDGAGGLRTPEQRQTWRDIVLSANPNAIIAFNRMAGPPFRSSAQCDYFGGHPEPRSRHKFWDPINLPMITAIEGSPWLNCSGEPVGDPNISALGHVFMGLQNRWTLGKCAFPRDQAIEWTTRVVSAGGMYTWAVPRAGSQIAATQFKLLKKIDKAVGDLGNCAK